MQGRCGASYAFAAVAAIEGATARATGQLKNLSVQNVIDCSGTPSFYSESKCRTFNDIPVQYSVATRAVELDQLLMHTSQSKYKEGLTQKSLTLTWQE